MLIGHETIRDRFENFVASDSLFHAYLFYGEPEIGKRSFAESLARYVEHGAWEESKGYLHESITIFAPEGDSLGIDEVRRIKFFFSEKPVYSPYRIVILDGAERLTPQAQHALLKVAEEPQKAGVIILIATHPDALLKTLQSRFQKIYFAPSPRHAVERFVTERSKADKEEVARITKLSFGRIGRAVKLMTDATFQKELMDARRFLKEPRERAALLEATTAEKTDTLRFVSHIIAYLSTDPEHYTDELKEALTRYVALSEWNTNRRLQMSSIMWNI